MYIEIMSIYVRTNCMYLVRTTCVHINIDSSESSDSKEFQVVHSVRTYI
jgi:hypothetical protein